MTVDFKDHALLDPPTNSDATETQSNYLICQVSGFRVPVEEGLHKRWDGLWVRREDFDQRHPLDFVRSVPERERRGSVAPEQPDRFITVPIENTTTGLELEDGSGVLLLEDGCVLLLEDVAPPAIITSNFKSEAGDNLLLESGDQWLLESA